MCLYAHPQHRTLLCSHLGPLTLLHYCSAAGYPLPAPLSARDEGTATHSSILYANACKTVTVNSTPLKLIDEECDGCKYWKARGFEKAPWGSVEGMEGGKVKEGPKGAMEEAGYAVEFGPEIDSGSPERMKEGSEKAHDGWSMKVYEKEMQKKASKPKTPDGSTKMTTYGNANIKTSPKGTVISKTYVGIDGKSYNTFAEADEADKVALDEEFKDFKVKTEEERDLARPWGRSLVVDVEGVGAGAGGGYDAKNKNERSGYWEREEDKRARERLYRTYS